MAGNLNYNIVNAGDLQLHILKWKVESSDNAISRNRTTVFHSHAYSMTNSIIQLKIIGYYDDLDSTKIKSMELYYLSNSPMFILNRSWLSFKFEKYDLMNVSSLDQYINITDSGLLSIPSKEWVGGWDLCKSYGEALEWSNKSNNGLNINCVFIVSNKNIHPLYPSDNFENETLSDALEKFINKDLFSDVIIRSVEGDEYKAHKVVLASRSAVLKAHFEHNTTECQTNCVESPLHTDILRKIINFIYTDKAQGIDERPELLLAAADYYDLKNLKTLCENALVKKLSIDNAIEILQLADLHSASSLKDKTQKFVKKNMKLIVQSDSWKNNKSIELMQNIVEYYFNSKD